MSRWEYEPIENIAFALQEIANTLERIENKMPVPHGVISTSTGPAESTQVEEVVQDLVEEELPEAEVDEVAE